MKELDECIKMLDKMYISSKYGMFSGSPMLPDDYEKLKAWIVAITKRVETLEADHEARQGDL